MELRRVRSGQVYSDVLQRGTFSLVIDDLAMALPLHFVMDMSCPAINCNMHPIPSSRRYFLSTSGT